LKAVRLPATREEVVSIAKRRRDATVLIDRNASEQNFKRHAPGRAVVHVATHAYSITGSCAGSGESGSWYAMENPLLQSGLLLAGANRRGRGLEQAGEEDGVLTALEVSAMDLRGTDLLVLSACETGLGKVEQGEGVYGLRRAFQMAGARTVVSSLWQVPDRETMAFMRDLYTRGGATYPELMQRASLNRIKELRMRGRPVHPFTWGAFVATGEWRIRLAVP
jgi:CHAT domain-containing protein